ncbi:hypothetical protein DY000_02023451 [Brassica cretica]|uniref:Uncharacterized protein n=1 Tax=Brassica cretica TaxID=69181 RepID=A0ABQ7EAM8_BRACR|nr:hypothetical protein DY000_02023451 [Brassica cretica]
MSRRGRVKPFENDPRQSESQLSQVTSNRTQNQNNRHQAQSESKLDRDYSISERSMKAIAFSFGIELNQSKSRESESSYTWRSRSMVMAKEFEFKRLSGTVFLYLLEKETLLAVSLYKHEPRAQQSWPNQIGHC